MRGQRKRRKRKEPTSDTELMVYLEAALKEPIGLELETRALSYLRNRLYALRKQRKRQGDDRFDSLVITVSPVKRNCLWLMKEEADEGL